MLYKLVFERSKDNIRIGLVSFRVWKLLFGAKSEVWRVLGNEWSVWLKDEFSAGCAGLIGELELKRTVRMLCCLHGVHNGAVYYTHTIYKSPPHGALQVVTLSHR